jgi:ferritin-like protein
MGKIGNQLIAGIAPADVADELDRLYCYHLVTFCWASGMGVRLEGQAIFLLGDELAEVAEENLAAARKLAARVGELGGVITIDPSAFVPRSPVGSLTVPDEARDVAAILRYALEQVRTALAAYGKLLDQTRGRDDLTHRLLASLGRQLAARATDLEGALA